MKITGCEIMLGGKERNNEIPLAVKREKFYQPALASMLIKMLRTCNSQSVTVSFYKNRKKKKEKTQTIKE